MEFGSATSTVTELEPTLHKVIDQALSALGEDSVDLACVFFTSHFEEQGEQIGRLMTQRFPSSVSLGGSAEGVIGPDGEHERVPAVSVFLASLPDVRIDPFVIDAEEFNDPDSAQRWVSRLSPAAYENPSFIILGDPFTVPVNYVLDFFNQTHPQRPVLGGMLSGCEAPGQSALIVDGEAKRGGLGGVVLTGNIDVQSVVSQGCRPIGQSYVITKCEGQVIQELGGKPALQRLKETVMDLSPEETKLAQQALFVGRVINEYQPEFGRGDFLIRNMIGIDPASGAIAVAGELRVGATVQFNIRDGQSADEDLRQMLQPYEEQSNAGALLFSCNGRGTRMWPEPNHDVGVLQDVCGDIPVAGFFAAGEIGPIGGSNFIHGHTASIALFREPSS